MESFSTEYDEHRAATRVPPRRPAHRHPSSTDGACQPDGLTLAPFRGTRYGDHVNLAAAVSPPYDLVGDEQLARLRAAEPHNVVRLILPAPGTADQPERYRASARTLRDWLSDGVLTLDDRPALYVYEHAEAAPDGTRLIVQRGLIGGVGLPPPESGIILPHEDVSPGPVADRLKLTTATEANLEPILLLYEGGGAASSTVDEIAATEVPLHTARLANGITHRLWAIHDPQRLGVVAADLANRQALIADGHHRYASYLRLREQRHRAGFGPGPWDRGLALLVDSVTYPPRLGAIHRFLPDLAPQSAARALLGTCTVRQITGDLDAALARLTHAERNGPAFVLAGGGQHWLVTDPDQERVDAAMPAQRSIRWRNLVTSILHRLVVPELWGIVEDEHNVRIVHHDAATAVRRADASGGTAVLLPPLHVPDVLAVAADGEKVPRKSTSFGPKPPSGLVLRTFAADTE